jgi:hypothetical protein
MNKPKYKVGDKFEATYVRVEGFDNCICEILSVSNQPDTSIKEYVYFLEIIHCTTQEINYDIIYEAELNLCYYSKIKEEE